MQQLTEGQISEPQEGENISGESSTEETLSEAIPDELGHVNGESYTHLIFLE